MDSTSSSAPISTRTPKRLSPRGLFRTARNLTLASIGIAGVLGDEAGALYRRSVERGGDTVQQVREQLPRVRRSQRRSSKPKGKRGRRSRQASDAIEATLARLNVATTADMDALAEHVAELGAKIDQLRP
jgi:polyhydroxyalkanoate synthesis regulator phasin